MIAFSKVEWKGFVSFWFVFSSKLSISNTVSTSYLAATKDQLKDTAAYLREIITEAFKNTLPLIVEDLDEMARENSPEELERFLNLVFSGNEPDRKI